MVWIALPVVSYAADNQPNCDMRQFDLTPIQKAKLRFIRIQHKNNLNSGMFNSVRQSSGNSQRAMNQLGQILMHSEFDDNQARRYVFEKYTSRMQAEVSELQVQHALLQVLNPKQRQDWIKNCLR